MAKFERITKRIANAVRALRGEPWPAMIEAPEIKETRANVQTCGAEYRVPLEHLDLLGPMCMDDEAHRAVASIIGRRLLETGCIEFDRVPDIACGVIRYRGKVRVVMPEKEGEHG